MRGSHFAVTQHKGQAEKPEQTGQDRAYRQAKLKIRVVTKMCPNKKNKIIIASTLEMQTVIYWKH